MDFAGYPRGHIMAKRIEIALLMAGLATFGLLYCTQAILPYFVADYRITPAQSALAVSVSTVGLGLGLLPAVPVSERIGRVRLLRWSLLSASILGIVVAILPDWNLFLIARFVQGFVLAGLPATAAVYLREEIHKTYVVAATGVYVFGTTLGGLSGRLFSAGAIEVVDRFIPGTSPLGLSHTQWAMLTVAVLALICAIVCGVLLPSSRGFVPSNDTTGELVKKFGRCLRDPVLVGLYGMGALGMGTFIGAFNVIGFRLEAAPYEMGVGAVSLLYLIYPVAGYAGILAGRAADKMGLRAVMPIGPLIALAGVGLLAAPNFFVIVAGMMVLGIGFFIIHSAASAWVAVRGQASVSAPAQAASLYMLFYYAGSSISGNLAAFVWQSTGWFGVSIFNVVLMGGALIIALLLRKTRLAGPR